MREKGTVREKQIQQKVYKVQTFPVELDLGEIKNNTSISTNTIRKPSKEHIINQAFKFHSKGNISKATKYYQYFIKQGFEDQRVFSNYGNILRDHGKLDEAEICQRKAIKLNPDFAEAHSNLGNILSDLGKLHEAEICQRKAIEINPSFSMAYANLGTILRDLGKLYEAEICQQKAIKINPNFALAYANLGNILRDLGKLNEAEICQRKAIEINPAFSMAYTNLGNILRDLGKLNEAEICQRKAISINPDFGEAYSNLGFILKDLGKLNEVTMLSEPILNLKSINQGDKLLVLLQITIASFLLEDFKGTILHINKMNELIKHGGLNLIKKKTMKKQILVYSQFISSLYLQIKKEKNNFDLDKIPHIGESHCLSFAHQPLYISSQQKKIQPVLITGGKAWHFANNKNNQWKDSLTQQIKDHTYSDQVFISFGEIDCRKDEGILNYAIKNDKDISEVCKVTIQGYLDYMEVILSPNYSKKYYFGIPAPTREKELLDDLDIKRIDMIKLYNSMLKKEVLSRSSYFLDVYKLTSNQDGINNNMYMCDDTHLSPTCLSILLRNHLYEP